MSEDSGKKEDKARQVGLGKVYIILSFSLAVARVVFDLQAVEMVECVH